MAICVPTYTLGGADDLLWAVGGEALWAVFIANVIVLIPLTLNAFGGTVRHSVSGDAALPFGIIGSNVPALIRGSSPVAGSASRLCLAASPCT
jgi:NCS1 family nucleobase:cation symporter-1